MRPAQWTTLLPVAAILAGLAGAATWSIRTGWADFLLRQETVADTEQAIALTPDQSECHARLAWLVSGDDAPRPKAALRRAVAVNPWDTRSRIELGLLAEVEGDDATSREYLLHAAEADRLFLPRWTLANYYFRRGDAAQFWFWAKQAGPMVYGDAQPLFRLCGRVEEDGNLIDRLQIHNPEVRAQYLSYLLGQNRVDLIGPAVHRLLDENRDTDSALLQWACERLLQARRVDEAAEIWNRQAAAQRVAFRTPAGKGEQLVANGSFAETPVSWGFDWRLPVVEGISFSREDESRGLRITFSGRQPEDCETLVQLVPLQPRGRFELSFVYRMPGAARAEGLSWRISDAGSGTVVKEGALAPAEADAAGQLWFDAPPECRLARLALRYRRAPGTTRLEGFLVLRAVALRPGVQPPIEGARVR